MNNVEYVEFYTAMLNQPETIVQIRRQHGIREYPVKSYLRALNLNTAVCNTMILSHAIPGPWGIMSIVYRPKPVGKVVNAHPVEKSEFPEGVECYGGYLTKHEQHDLEREEERVYIRNLYEFSSTKSNTDPSRALELYNRCKQLEEAWFMKYYDELSDDESIMPHNFYLCVVPIIKSRAAAKQEAVDRIQVLEQGISLVGFPLHYNRVHISPDCL